METQSEASAGAAQADRRQPVPPAPGATAFKCGRPVTLLHQTGQGKSTVAQIHAGGATPPADRPQWGVRDNGDGAQLGVSLARARALVAPPSLCFFHISEDCRCIYIYRQFEGCSTTFGRLGQVYRLIDEYKSRNRGKKPTHCDQMPRAYRELTQQRKALEQEHPGLRRGSGPSQGASGAAGGPSRGAAGASGGPAERR